MSNSAFTVTGTVNAPAETIARAWINFTTSGGNVVINSSYNIASATYISTGKVTINITPGTFSSALYAVANSIGGFGAALGPPYPTSMQSPSVGTVPTANSITIQILSSTGAVAEAQFASLIFFGT